MSQKSKAKALLGVLGEILVTLAAVALLYIFYQLVYTNLNSEIQTRELASDFKSRVLDEAELSSNGVNTNSAEPKSLKPATVIGLMYIPALKSDVWGEPIVAGTGYSELAQGIGHYTQNQLPAEAGNFAVAGHRVTYGQPFYHFEKLATGDEVFVLMEEGWYSYELIANEKIQESEVWVLGEVQSQLGLSPEEKIITLTTCDPRWNSTRRWAWWGIQTGFYPADQPPAALGEDF